MIDADKALVARDVSFRYGDGPLALSGASLALRPGELVGVIGPNGSGKSTLLRVSLGALRPEAGSVTLDGAPIALTHGEALARRVAFLPQRVEEPFAFTCEEVVAQGRYPRLSAMGFLSPEDIRVVRESMRRTETEAFASRSLEDLSGGERQRVLIASALAQETDYLLLDEPTSSLDIQHQAEIFALLRRSSREGKAVCVVIHDLNLAAQFCDRLVLMNTGQTVMDGAPADVLRQEALASVYGDSVVVAENPVTGGPLVVAMAHDDEEATPCRF